MTKLLNNSILVLIFRLIIGYIFISYGIGKIANPEKFTSEIINYKLFPEFTLNLIALILPWLELTSGIFITFGIRLKSNSVIIATMMIIFTLSVIWAMSLGLDINCGCSSTSPQKVGFPKLLENIGLLISSIYIYFSNNNKFSFESLIEK